MFFAFSLSQDSIAQYKEGIVLSSSSDLSLMIFLHKDGNWYFDPILIKLSPNCTNDDHRLDLIQERSSPNDLLIELDLHNKRKLVCVQWASGNRNGVSQLLTFVLTHFVCAKAKWVQSHVSSTKEEFNREYILSSRIENIFDKLYRFSLSSGIDLKNVCHQIIVVPLRPLLRFILVIKSN